MIAIATVQEEGEDIHPTVDMMIIQHSKRRLITALLQALIDHDAVTTRHQIEVKNQKVMESKDFHLPHPSQMNGETKIHCLFFHVIFHFICKLST